MSLDYTLKNISSKFIQVDSLIEQYNEKRISATSLQVLLNLISILKEIVSISEKSLDFLNNELICENFQQVLQIVDSSSNSILYYLTFLTNNPNNDEQIITNNIKDLYQCAQIFLSNFRQIINRYTQSESVELLQNWLGLESFLFSFCVNVQPIQQIPFFNLKIVNMYKCYEKVNSMENAVSAVTSFCGTGKTICIPIILLCRSLKDNMNIPFLMLSEPIQNQVESFFKQKVSKFVTVTTNKTDFLDLVKKYDEDHQSLSKLVFGIFNPYDFLCLTLDQKIPKMSRFVVDEIHQRSMISDVLITKISDFYKENLFTFPLNVILMSSSFSSSLLSLFESSSIESISLCDSSQYEIVEKPPIYDHFIKKIKTEIVPNETINIINKMATVNSEIEEGHILCYLPGIFVCEQVKKTVISLLINNEETETKRKVIFLKTTLKHNEPLEKFYEKVREEYRCNEKLREVGFKFEFLYFLPLNYSGLSEESLFYLVKDELPNDLRKINKLIFSTSLSEPSINDKLSVVIDSGLVKENGFDYSISVRTIKDIQASKEIMYLRKGRLGRSMKGLYVPIQTDKSIADFQTPLIQRDDITKNVLLLKDINIDIENIKNLPDKPDENNLKISLENLVYIGAIDEGTSKITELGHSILQFPFISIYYAAAMQIFKKEFEEEEEIEKEKTDGEENMLFFIGGYISTVLTKSNFLIQEEMSENLSKVFVKESDIATIINALNILLKSPINENDELRNLVESYGFSYSVFCDLKSNIQQIIDQIYESKTINEVLDLADEFIENHEGILSILDKFIGSVEQTYPSFTDSNYITFKCVNGSSCFDNHSSLVFKASDNLKFPKKRQQNSEIIINRRPGWNGISIPTECYLFNVTRNINYNTNSGFLIHRATPESKSLISTIEVDKIAFNPYFCILLEIYFKDLQLTHFKNDPKNHPNQSYPFHYSNAGDRVFVSFISEEGETMKKQILQGANKVIKLLPYTPRSVLILRSDGNAIVEVTSLGAQNYNTSISTYCNGNLLDKRSIEYCLNNLDELAKLDSRIRICSLFVNESCELKYFDRKNLYIINEFYNKRNPPLLDIILPQIQRINYEINQKQQINRRYIDESKNKKKEDFILFQFQSDFIHPSLIRYQESLNSILKWFEKFKQGKIIQVIGSQLLMKRNEAERLKYHIQNEREMIKGQMNLNYVAIQIPSKIYEKTFLIIKEHPTWHYDKKYRAIVTTKEESEEVNRLIESNKTELTDEKDVSKFIESNLPSQTLCCLYSCDNPEEPVLTQYPLTVFFRDGTYYISRACHDCLLDNFKYHLNYLFDHGIVDQNKVEGISIRPNIIPSVESIDNEDGSESWPVIPLGLMVYVLINDEIELSSYVSAWLYSIEEFTIRIMMQNRFLWCNIHTHHIFDIVKLGNKLFRCKECDNEILQMEPDDEETMRRKEEKELRDKENRIFQEVENEIRNRVEIRLVRLTGNKIKRKQEEIDKLRAEIELEIRNEEINEIRNDILTQINKEERIKRLREEKRRKEEEEKRKEDERIRKIQEKRRRLFLAALQKDVDFQINKMVEERVLIEIAETGNEVDGNRRKEIELEIRKNENEIRDNIIQERRRIAEEEARKRNEKNNFKSLLYIDKLKKCPRCNKPIIKNGGCNHMTCQCGCHFCWLCFFQANNAPEIYDHIRKKHNGNLFG